MYSEEDATDAGAPSPLADERRYEYKKLLMEALAEVCLFLRRIHPPSQCAQVFTQYLLMSRFS